MTIARMGVEADLQVRLMGCLAKNAVVRCPFVASGNNSVVECDLAKVEVAGSNPVSRSTFPPSPPRG